MTKPKILLFDIETFPNLAYVWGKYEQNAIAFQKEWELASFAWKWLGDPNIFVSSRNSSSELSLTKQLYNLFATADVVVAHNGDSFDIKKVKSKFAQFNLKPCKPIKSVDTKKIAKSQFGFTSNSLNDLGERLKLGKKAETGGFQLWLDCMAGDQPAWGKMERYNKQDVVLLEKLYLKLRAWAPNHPNLAFMEDRLGCPKCGSKNTHKRGFQIAVKKKKQRHQCGDCGGWFCD